MSGIWNPFAFDIHGNPLPPAAPPALRVMTEGISGDQLAMVQRTFFSYCARQRASVVPNHMEQGRLTDGTPYRIVKVGVQTIMQVWPSNESNRRTFGYLFTPADKDHTTGWPVPDAYLPDADISKIKLHSEMQAGAVNWIGQDGTLLSWNHGYNNRYGTDRWDNVLLSDGSYPTATEQAGIYYHGVLIETPAAVWAAAMFGGWLVFISNETVFYAQSPLGQIDSAWQSGEVPDPVSPTWHAVTVTGSKSTLRKVSAWHFARDGSKAACATVVQPSGGWGSWSLYRGCTEALPQSKLYIALSTAESGGVAAAFVEEAYSGEPWSTTFGAQMVYRDVTSQRGPGGVSDVGYIADLGVQPVVNAGRRLWGIDFGGAGEEILVTCRRWGGGEGKTQYIRGATLPQTERRYADIETHWGIFANDDVIAQCTTKGACNMVYTAESEGDPGVWDETTYGPSRYEFASIHEVDARFGAAVIERCQIEFDAGTFVQSGTSFYSEPGTAEAHIDWVMGGEIVHTLSIPQPADIEFEYRMSPSFGPVTGERMGPGGTRYITNLAWLSDYLPLTSDVPGSAKLNIASFPQTQDRHGEGLHSDIIYGYFAAGMAGVSPLTIGPPHLAQYPNQITDLLVCSSGYQGMNRVSLLSGYEFEFSLFGLSYLYDTSAVFTRYVDAFKRSFVKGGGFARTQWKGNSYVMTAKNGFTWAFYNFAYGVRQYYIGTPKPTDFFPVYAAALFKRPDGASPYEMLDLVAPTKTLIEGEEDAGPIHSETFHLDPVRAI